MYRESRKGFTLIEVLIVVAIIGILASVILIGLGPITRKGRDARRISDLKQVQNGLELYFQKNGQYPPDQDTTGAALDWGKIKSDLTAAGVGIANVPDDPNVNAGSDYFYGTSTDFKNYVLGATMEDGTNSALKDDVDGTVFAVNCVDDNGVGATPPFIYCVQL